MGSHGHVEFHYAKLLYLENLKDIAGTKSHYVSGNKDKVPTCP